MSGIPIIGKVFDLIEDIPILKVVAVAAIVYFSAGAATSAFSSAGATTAAAGGGAAATTAANVGAASATAGAATAGAATAGTAAATTAATTTAATTAAATGATAAAAAPAATSWFAANPMATMMLGQGIVGAVSSAEADKRQKEADAEAARIRKEERENRGLMGFDFEGNPGIVHSSMQAPDRTVPPAEESQIQAPTVQEQQVASTGTQLTPQQVPVPREDLPKLNVR